MISGPLIQGDNMRIMNINRRLLNNILQDKISKRSKINSAKGSYSEKFNTASTRNTLSTQKVTPMKAKISSPSTISLFPTTNIQSEDNQIKEGSASEIKK